MPHSPGQKLGAYEVVSPLGAGGMGEVYRARDSKLKRDVAIKVLPADVANDRERLARFQREAEVLASLNHPHIAQVYAFETLAHQFRVRVNVWRNRHSSPSSPKLPALGKTRTPYTFPQLLRMAGRALL